MALSDRIKACRAQHGLSQAQLAERLHVSRQAVTKWESGRGYPDLENLTAMARLFDVTVDHLLDDDGASPAGAVLRHPVDVAALEPYKPAGKPLGSKSHAAVRQVYPSAEVYPLTRARGNNRVQEAIEWGMMLVFDAPYGVFGGADALSDRDAHYLVRQPNRDPLVRVTKDAVESRELPGGFPGKKLVLGQDTFRRASRAI